jgi:hypothetical protein
MLFFWSVWTGGKCEEGEGTGEDECPREDEGGGSWGV